MTDKPINPLEAENNNLVPRDAAGDPLPLGTRMIERESYERVIEGLKIAAEGAAHLAVHEYRVRNAQTCAAYSGLARRLDQVRLLAVDVAGLDETAMRQRETQEVRKEPLRFLQAKRRLREGLKQAAGGMRQLATCHRNDLRWSMMAESLEELQRKVTHGPSSILRPMRPKLIMPEHVTRQ